MRLGRRKARLVGAVHEQSPDLLERHGAHEVLDVHPAVAQRPAFLVRLGDLGREGDDALQARLHLGHSPPPPSIAERVAEWRRIVSKSRPAICHTDAIRTTLDIDDRLLEALQNRLPGRSKTEAIEHAIGEYLSGDAVRSLRAMAGTLEVEDVSSDLRRRDRTT
jgi:hypothetical protein